MLIKKTSLTEIILRQYDGEYLPVKFYEEIFFRAQGPFKWEKFPFLLFFKADGDERNPWYSSYFTSSPQKKGMPLFLTDICWFDT